RDRFLDGHHDDVAQARVLPLAAAEHLDAEHLAGARIVGDVEDGFGLDHEVGPPSVAASASAFAAAAAFSASAAVITSASASLRDGTACPTQRLSRDSARVSTSRTRSPS